MIVKKIKVKLMLPHVPVTYFKDRAWIFEARQNVD